MSYHQEGLRLIYRLRSVPPSAACQYSNGANPEHFGTAKDANDLMQGILAQKERFWQGPMADLVPWSRLLCLG